MIDWIQSLIAGLSAGIGCTISLILRAVFLNTAKTGKQRFLITVFILALYVGFVLMFVREVSRIYVFRTASFFFA